MHIAWRERLIQSPTLQDFSRWPYIDVDSLPADKRVDYQRNRRIVAKVLAGKMLKEVAKEENITISRITKLLTRCLGGEESEEPVLSAGLVPFSRVRPNERHLALPSLTTKYGNPGAFNALLRAVPNLQENLDAVIKAKLADTDYAQTLLPQTFHGTFKRLLEETHWPMDRYPYTTDSVAYESVRTYLHQRVNELLAERQAKKKSQRIVTSRQPFARAQKITQIDEHVLDVHSSVHFELNEELIPLRISRLSGLVAKDVATDCHLGCELAFTLHPNQQDMLALFDRMVNAASLPELTTPGFVYADGADFPVNCLNDFPVSFGLIQYDNALMHTANSVRDLICAKLAATKNQNLPAAPKTRNWIEAAFAYINQHGLHRFASTAGSHIKDPKRESRKNSKRVPVLTWQALKEAYYITVTMHNVIPQGRLGGATPLELYRKHCAEHYMRYIPNLLRQNWNPFDGRKRVPIKWLKNEKRIPHINFLGARYKGAGLLRVVNTDNEVDIVFDRRDIRQLNAYSVRGESLGSLLAPLSWQRFPHSIKTRQIINKLVKNIRLSSKDPLSGYFFHLLKNKGKAEDNLQLLRIYLEYTQNSPASLTLNDNIPVSVSRHRGNVAGAATEVWSLDIAKHKR